MPPDRAVLSTQPFTAATLDTRAVRAPEEGEVEVGVLASGLGREDALIALGQDSPPLPRPLVPGCDLAGVVLRSAHARWRRGDAVVMTGHGLGCGPQGGWAERACLPGGLLLPLPPGFSPVQAAAIGTPGLAAMRAAEALDELGVLPEAGNVLVTGATGGLGALAVLALSSLDYRVVAVTRRPELRGWLAGLGAAEILPFAALRRAPVGWAAAVDVLGGTTLALLIEGTRRGGVVVALGELRGAALRTGLLPFVRRGVMLLGLDMREAAQSRRAAAWARWAERGPGGIEAITTTVGLEAAPDAARALLRGRSRGRVVVRIATDP